MSENKSYVRPILIGCGSLVGLLLLGSCLLGWVLSGGRTVSNDLVELTLPWDYLELPLSGGPNLMFGSPRVKLVVGSVSKAEAPVESLEGYADLARDHDATQGRAVLGQVRVGSVGGYPARFWRAEVLGKQAFQGVIETPEHYHSLVWVELISGGPQDEYLKIFQSFRLRGDPPPAEPGTLEELGEPEAEQPSPEELREQAYLELHEALRTSTSPEERLALVERWRAQKFDEFEGAWRDLILSIAGGASSEALEAAQLAETERLQPSNEAIVAVLPKVRPRVRRGLLARFRDADQAEREACLAALTKTDDLDDPAILEAYLVLGVVTAYRVSRMIRAEGLEWTEDPLLGELLQERAREKPGFVDALLGDKTPAVRQLACSLAELAPDQGDERLTQLVTLLRDDARGVRLAAVEALTTLAKPRASWGLARAFALEEDEAIRERLLAALAASEPEPTLNLILRLQQRKVDDQRAAALALQAFAPALVAEALGRALASEDQTVVEAALQSLIALARREGGAQALGPCREGVAALDPDGALGGLRAQVLLALDRDS